MKVTEYLAKKKADQEKAKKAGNIERKEIFDRINRLEKLAEDAAKEGNASEYNKLDAELIKAHNTLYVLNRAEDKGLITREDIIDLWGEYSKSYNERYNTLYQDYLKRLQAAADSYKKLVSAQNEMLKEREASIDAIAARGSETKSHITYDVLAAVPMVPAERSDIKLFAEYKLLTHEEVETIPVILNGLPQEDLEAIKPGWDSKPQPKRENIYTVMNERRKIIEEVKANKKPLSAINWLDNYPKEIKQQALYQMLEKDYYRLVGNEI